MQKDSQFKPTIGLEIHAELKTNTKMFCACKNDSDEKRPNVNICPVCMGHPGTLPVINKQAVKNVLKVGLAINGELALEFSEFDRKNYFYPDIPKAYQISQYKFPLVSGGELAGVQIERIHLEEDTAKSSHDKGDYSLVDFNRAGVPLMELVTKPVIHSGDEIIKFGEELQKTLQYLGVAEANMEKGEMRLEVNISVSNEEGKLGTKVEVKNINSFRAAKSAAMYEEKRQIEVLEGGGKVTQETRGWDEKTQSTFSQRSKEDSHDYRYFPDPDLPKLRLKDIPEFAIEALRMDLKETPEQKRKRYTDEYGIKESDIGFYVENLPLAKLFEDTVSGLKKENFQLVSNYVVSDIAGLGEKGISLNPKHLADLIEMAVRGDVSSRGVKDIILKMSETGEDPKVIAEREGLIQKNDEAELLKVVEAIITANPTVVADYRSGKVALIQFFVGQAMKETKGSGNPQVLKALFEKSLS